MKRGNNLLLQTAVDAKIIAIDSMCFIYYFEAHEQYGPLVRSIFSLITSGKAVGVTSVITLAETMTTSLLRPDQSGVRVLYRDRLVTMQHLQVKDVDVTVAEQSALYRHMYQLKLGDAMQLATAVGSGARLFVTNDVQFRRVKELKVAILDDFL